MIVNKFTHSESMFMQMFKKLNNHYEIYSNIYLLYIRLQMMNSFLEYIQIQSRHIILVQLQNCSNTTLRMNSSGAITIKQKQTHSSYFD